MISARSRHITLWSVISITLLILSIQPAKADIHIHIGASHPPHYKPYHGGYVIHHHRPIYHHAPVHRSNSFYLPHHHTTKKHYKNFQHSRKPFTYSRGHSHRKSYR